MSTDDIRLSLKLVADGGDDDVKLALRLVADSGGLVSGLRIAKRELDKLAGSIDKATSVGSRYNRVAHETASAIRETARSFLEAIGSDAVESIAAMREALTQMQSVINRDTTTALDGVRRFLNDYIDMALDATQQIEQVIQTTFQGIEDALMDFVTSGQLSVVGMALDVAQQIEQMIQTTFQGIKDVLTDFVTSGRLSVVDMALGVVQQIGQVIQTTFQGIKDVLTNFVTSGPLSLIDMVLDAAQQIGEVIQTTFQGMEDALTDFVISGQLNFSELADSIIGDLARIAIQQNILGPLNAEITDWFGGLFGGAEAERRASGGYVSGPGTGTSDSIPAMLSDGEYVLSAAAVRRWGVHFLDGLNGAISAPIPRLGYATGGPVMPATHEAQPVRVEITNQGTPQQIADARATVSPRDVIVQVVTADARDSGPITQSLGAAFGVRR